MKQFIRIKTEKTKYMKIKTKLMMKKIQNKLLF